VVVDLVLVVVLSLLGGVVPFWLTVDPNKFCLMSLNLRFRAVAEMSVSSFLLVMLLLMYSSHKNMTRTPLDDCEL
jgi:hypothetical protein